MVPFVPVYTELAVDPAAIHENIRKHHNFKFGQYLIINTINKFNHLLYFDLVLNVKMTVLACGAV